jgi:hypothetical protein
MKRGWSIRSLIGLAAVLMVSFPSFALGEDIIGFSGKPLTNQEMAETRGGLSLPDGNFIEFSMDFMSLKFLSHNDPNSINNQGWINNIQQKARISNDGIQFDMEILQGAIGGSNDEGRDAEIQSTGNDSNNSQGTTPQINQVNNVLPCNSFTDFNGMSNANLIAGNYNVGSITNIFNIELNFYNSGNLSLPALDLLIP